MYMKERIKFPIAKTMDVISKANNAGKIGVLQDTNLRVKMPDFVKQGDFPQNASVRSKQSRIKSTGSLLSRKKYEETKYKETQIDIAGFEAGKVDDFNFRGKGSLKYNPFANAAGHISQVGGHNKGGDEDNNSKDKENIINPRFKLGKRNPRSHLPQTINQPNPFPNQLEPDSYLKKPSGFRIKSRKSKHYACD